MIATETCICSEKGIEYLVQIIAPQVHVFGALRPADASPDTAAGDDVLPVHISFLEIHEAELRETERVIAKATANGWARQIELNERKRNNLVNIITSLERAHG